MIRFIDIRNQGTGARFTFWSTSSDRFISIDGEFAWNSWGEFAEVAQGQVDLDRYRRICPSWVDDGEEDDIESFYDPSSESIK
ncbi:hypothetical protein [Neptuniibacter halophilus]|uniref:hypothetical protein n=1 Tax=Neptuniibacter halophilus TaxID=651666 RepID=UPI0025735FC7|nr:hypothetical protein [Neptuniibacter halophilus]